MRKYNRQNELLEFIRNPEILKQVVEASMDKRIAILDKNKKTIASKKIRV